MQRVIHQSRFLMAGILLAFPANAFAAPGQENDRRASLYHLDGTSEDIARGDIIYCMSVARPALSSRSKSGMSTQYGLMGALLGDFLGSGPTNRMRNTVVQKCMVSHGYRLYLVGEATWKRILGLQNIVNIKGDSADTATVDALASFASKPLPTNEGLSL